MKLKIAKFRLTLQASIILLLTILLSTTGLIVTYAAYEGSKASIYTIARNMMNEISKQVLAETYHYLSPAKPVALTTADFMGKNLVSLSNKDSLVDYLKNVLKIYPSFLNAYFADERGNVWMARRMLDGTFSVRHVERTETEVITRWEHQSAVYNKEFHNITQNLEQGYNPLVREWYKKAQDTNQSVWINAYIFHTDKRPGITHAVGITDQNGRNLGVFAIDIGLANLSHFLGDLTIGKHGKAFILDQKNDVIALPIKRNEPEKIEKLLKVSLGNNPDSIEYKNRSVNEIEDNLLKAAFEKYKNDKNNDNSYFFHFSYDNKAYVSMFMPFNTNSNLMNGEKSEFQWLVGVVLPEDDILEEVYKYNRLLIGTTTVLVSLAILFGILLSRVISKPLAILSKQMDDVKQFKIEDLTAIDSPLYEVNTMTQSFNGMKNVLLSFQKYIPHEVVYELIKEGKEAQLGGEKRELTILFSDIAQFTNIAESLPPEELVENLGIYFAEMSSIILEHTGAVDKYIGDSVMAFWNAPKLIENHALLACQAALQMQRASIMISQRFTRQQKPAFNTRIGLNTGTVVVGNIGSERRLNYTVLGDAVNLASRLESLNKYYDTRIIVSETTYEQAKEHFAFRWLDKVAVKGKTLGVDIYELISEKDNLICHHSGYLNLYREASELYRARRWQEAHHLLEELNRTNNSDKPTQVLLERCVRFIQNPPAAEWTGIFEMTQK